MYNIKTLQQSLIGLVGFKESRNAAYGTLTPELTASRSGLFVESTHALLTKEHIHASISLEEYKDVAAASILDTYLKDVVQDSIAEVFSRVFTEKKLQYQTKALFEDVQLYSGAGQRQQKVLKEGRFVGFELHLKNMRDIDFEVYRIGLQLDTLNPTFNLYLYHTSQAAPLETFTFNVDKPGMFQWFSLKDINKRLKLNYVNSKYSTEGNFILGYYESQVLGQAIEMKKDLHTGPCQSCNAYDIQAYQAYSKFVSIHPFSVDAAELAGTNLWDVKAHEYHYNTNFGINLSFTTQCDITDFCLRNELLFADAIAKACGVKLLNNIAFSTENKGVSEKIRGLARYELDNKENNTLGSKAQYENALKALSFDLSGLNSACLPTVHRKRVSHGAM